MTIRVEINPKVLVWARENARLRLKEAAHRIGVTPDRLIDWENSGLRHTVRQLQLIGKAYGRPSAFLYRKNLPPTSHKNLVFLPAGRRCPQGCETNRIFTLL